MNERPVNVMTNPGADRVKKVAHLAGRSVIRNKRKQFVVEGPQSVREALKAHTGQIPNKLSFPWKTGKVVEQIYWTEDLISADPELARLVADVVSTGGVFGAEATQEVLDAMGDAVTQQYVLAVCAVPDYSQLSPADVFGTLHIVLCRVQDPGNVGTIIRVADAAGADAVFLTPGSADIFNPKTVRSTAGSLFHLPVIAGADLNELAQRAQDRRINVLAADGHSELELFQASSLLARPTLWLVGNEAQGLSAEERALADDAVAVPLYGLAESLNVATAATVCLYASAMQQRR